MTDPGLTNRLRQHSRRAGVMVGLTMALTIGLCVAGFVGIYTALAPFTSDFVNANATARPAATAAPTKAPRAAQAAAPAPTAAAQVPAIATQPPAVPPTAAVPAIVPVATSATFKQSHTSNERFRINLRAQPTQGSNVVVVLPPSTPLQFLNQTADDSGTAWLKFRTQEGKEGWVRQIDSVTAPTGA